MHYKHSAVIKIGFLGSKTIDFLMLRCMPRARHIRSHQGRSFFRTFCFIHWVRPRSKTMQAFTFKSLSRVKNDIKAQFWGTYLPNDYHVLISCLRSTSHTAGKLQHTYRECRYSARKTSHGCLHLTRNKEAAHVPIETLALNVKKSSSHTSGYRTIFLHDYSWANSWVRVLYWFARTPEDGYVLLSKFYRCHMLSATKETAAENTIKRWRNAHDVRTVLPRTAPHGRIQYSKQL